jgi:hypothetical protein
LPVHTAIVAPSAAAAVTLAARPLYLFTEG